MQVVVSHRQTRRRPFSQSLDLNTELEIIINTFFFSHVWVAQKIVCVVFWNGNEATSRS